MVRSNVANLDVERLIDQMAEELRVYIANRDIIKPAMIGIHTGGAWVAERLHKKLGVRWPLGTLNISFYRDDFTRIGLHPQVQPSHLPFEVNHNAIILVDDVVQTGRTIRAALNEVFDYGRPNAVVLTTLIERQGRELPIRADVVGARINLKANEMIKLTGPDPLQLVVSQKNPQNAAA